MILKLLKIIIILGVLILPLINSRITNILWFSFWYIDNLFLISELFPYYKDFAVDWLQNIWWDLVVNWNYEFTKVMFFNVWIWLLSFLFCSYIVFWEKKVKLTQNTAAIIVLLLIILATSTLHSVSPYDSIFWTENKWHWVIMFLNLIVAYIIIAFIGNTKYYLTLLKTFILSALFVSLVWIKEYYIPSLSYWDLWSRFFSTFGHPNYISIFYLSFIPILLFLFNQSKSTYYRVYYLLMWFLFIYCLLLTKSLLAFILLVLYSTYYALFNLNFAIIQRSKNIILTVIFIIFLLWWVSVLYLFPEKLHSFISRFFIWEMSLKAITLNFQTVVFGQWLETFWLVSDMHKWEYLYIFENLWFNADRPHNILLNFFYHFGIMWIFWIFFMIYKLFIRLQDSPKALEKTCIISLLLMLIFWMFNYPSITHYVIIIILLPLIFHKKPRRLFSFKWNKLCIQIVIVGLLLASLFWWYFSFKYYYSEMSAYSMDYVKAAKLFPYNLTNYLFSWNFWKYDKVSNQKTQEYFRSHIMYSQKNWDREKICHSYSKYYNIAETYFYCWNIFWDVGEYKIAKRFYQEWLSLLPDLWKKDSPYYNKVLIKHCKITGHRFLSDKYGLGIILKRLEMKIRGNSSNTQFDIVSEFSINFEKLF